jgi:uncharacterized protein YPO0396
MNLSLFSTKSEESGFRLHTYEVWNWGTFDHKVWSILPGGETSLLTGANASGKTTIVDGLLTLLVPEKRMRFYNQTAGSKGERTEESYVVGEYGETENADTNTREIKKLRPEKAKAQSILLAVFQNESQFITLAQARWFSGSELKRTFVLAYKKLSIMEDFMPFDSNSEWKKRLKHKYPKQGSKDLILFPESAIEYGRAMRKVFGMRSDKAHTLFSQTIGLKVLGNLDEFVRTQMLEERDSETEFQKINAYFKTLNDAHTAIEKAYKQIELLTPIREKANNLSTLKANLFKLEGHQQVLPLWFANTSQKLIKQFLEVQAENLEDIDSQIKKAEYEIEQFRDREKDLDLEILTGIGSQISSLERENKVLEKEKSEKEAELKQYNILADKLDLQSNPQGKELFEEQRSLASSQKSQAEVSLKQIGEDIYITRKDKEEIEISFDQVSNELTILRSQKNNITGAPARIRKELADHLNIAEDDIPFVGELIKVKQNEKSWEPAIESLLHNFALRLLIPETYQNQVNSYVHNNDLKGRIVYHILKPGSIAPNLFHQPDPKELIHKLEFKNLSNKTVKDWVENEIINRYNYICTNDLEEFRLADRAITNQGLIKNASRHEKDDRPKVNDRRQYILGWDNKEKIATLREEAELLNKQLTDKASRHKQLENQQSRLNTEKENLNRFIGFNSYTKIDWWSVASQIQENNAKIAKLTESNDRITALKDERDELKQLIKSKNKSLDELKDTRTKIKLAINTYEQKRKEAENIIDKYDDLPIHDKLKDFEDLVPQNETATINNIEAIRSKTNSLLLQQIKNVEDQERNETREAESLMRKFIYPDKEIADKYSDWSSDTHKLSENAAFIDDFVALLEKIEKQELATYKLQFKKFLNEEMITRMSDFQTWLVRQEDDIEDNIDTLNRSLHKINFKNNPSTFIKLHVEKDYTPQVRDFKIKLNDWKPNIAEYEKTKDDSILEYSFNKIKSLLSELTENESIRKSVLDVRNWLKFKAVEHHREDPSKIFRSYTGTAKLSGGEGAQLTYTILGSAIAYQFGIHNEGLNPNSFRFICVDEAFSKQDDEKARFLMELCKQLHLQVMVVSPAKAEEVAIVEPYIARVHFVQRKDNRHSVIYDMPILQLIEQRNQYLQEAY